MSAHKIIHWYRCVNDIILLHDGINRQTKQLKQYTNPLGAKQSCDYLLKKSHGPTRLPYAIYPLSASDIVIGLHAGLHNFI
jgi:hypothetical protein